VFTGLVQTIGVIERAERRADSLALSIGGLDTADLALGESIAIDGVCLTVARIERDRFEAVAGAETLRRTTLGGLRARAQVNLERAVRPTDRLGGHIVQGHVDGVGDIATRRDLGANLEIGIRPPRDLLRYMVEKGSIAVDGISLTVNRADATSFSVALIPHTVENTGLAGKRIGDKVNLEVDIIAKYVEKLLGERVSRA